MSLSNRISDFKEQLKKELKPDKTASTNSEVGLVEFSISEVPKIIEKKGYDWVLWGEDNMYPYQISDLKYGSAIHNAIISTAADMIAGDGFLINGAKTEDENTAAYAALTPDQKTIYDSFIKNQFGTDSLEEVNRKLALDAKDQGGFCYEITYNSGFKTVANVKYVDIKNVRAGKMENDKVKSYWYCRDWSQWKKPGFKPTELYAFDKTDKEHLNQLVYKKRGPLEYYPQPDYIGCLTWIQTDYQMGIFHLSNIENGMNPSLLWEFFKLPPSEDAKQTIMDDIRTTYKGAKKTGKHIVLFSDGTENAAKVGPVNVNNLDKQLLLLAQLCDQKILTGHKLTSPLLAGISTAGQIGGNTELEKAFQVYDKTRIKPYRNMLSDSYQTLLDINGATFKININPFNPFT